VPRGKSKPRLHAFRKSSPDLLGELFLKACSLGFDLPLGTLFPQKSYFNQKPRLPKMSP